MRIAAEPTSLRMRRARCVNSAAHCGSYSLTITGRDFLVMSYSVIVFPKESNAAHRPQDRAHGRRRLQTFHRYFPFASAAPRLRGFQQESFGQGHYLTMIWQPLAFDQIQPADEDQEENGGGRR